MKLKSSSCVILLKEQVIYLNFCDDIDPLEFTHSFVSQEMNDVYVKAASILLLQTTFSLCAPFNVPYIPLKGNLMSDCPSSNILVSATGSWRRSWKPLAAVNSDDTNCWSEWFQNVSQGDHDEPRLSGTLLCDPSLLHRERNTLGICGDNPICCWLERRKH